MAIISRILMKWRRGVDSDEKAQSRIGHRFGWEGETGDKLFFGGFQGSAGASPSQFSVTDEGVRHNPDGVAT